MNRAMEERNRGESPSAYRLRGAVPDVPTCFAMRWRRPADFGEAPRKIG